VLPFYRQRCARATQNFFIVLNVSGDGSTIKSQSLEWGRPFDEEVLVKDIMLKLCGAIFLLIALVHLFRIVYAVPVIIGRFSVPVSWSIVGSTVSLILYVLVQKAVKVK
jgi:hypothetical protein